MVGAHRRTFSEENCSFIGKMVFSFALLDPLLGPFSKENGHTMRFWKENAHFIGKIGLLFCTVSKRAVFFVLTTAFPYFSALTRQYLYLHHRALGRGVYQVPGWDGEAPYVASYDSRRTTIP